MGSKKFCSTANIGELFRKIKLKHLAKKYMIENSTREKANSFIATQEARC